MNGKCFGANIFIRDVVIVINRLALADEFLVASCDSLWEMRDISRVVPWIAPRR